MEAAVASAVLPTASTEDETAAAIAPVATETTLAADGPTVLVVDDEPVDRMILRQMLEAGGCRVTAAVDAPPNLTYEEKGIPFSWRVSRREGNRRRSKGPGPGSPYQG